MSNELIPISDIERMAAVVAKSGLFGVKSVEQAAALMMIAHAEGLHPATAAMDYDIIQGRPAKKPQAMLRDYLRAGGKVEWHEHTDERVAATFSHPAGGSVRIEWDMKRAMQAGLGGKDNWKKFPRQMLRARVISEGIRATYPGATGGMYVPEEVADMEPRDITPRAEVLPPEKPTVSGKLKAAAAQVDTSTGEVLPTSDLLPRIAACKTVAEVDALRPEVAKLPKGSHERQIAVETAKAMIEELSAAPKPSAMDAITAMPDDVI